MDAPPDDSTSLPPQRRSSGTVPPFVAPRGGESESAKQPPAATRRPSTPLFVPPTTQTGEMPVPEAPKKTPAAAAPPVEPARPTPATARETSSFHVENLETPEIALRITGERPAIGDTELQLISYDDANTGLQANTEQGKMPRFDGIELESTELSLEPSKNAGMTPSELKIESFWAAEAFTPTVRPDPASDTPRPITPSTLERVADAPPKKRSTLEALRVEEVPPPRMQTPQSVRSITPRANKLAMPVDIRTPAALEALKEMEPWALPSTVAPESGNSVADALERVARRIRSGELKMPSDVAASTDENALSAALQALVRSPRR